MNINKYSTLINSAIDNANQIKQSKDGWKFVKKGKYYTLQKKTLQNSEFKLLKLEGVISASMEEVQSFYFENYQGQKSNRDMCEDIYSLEAIDRDTRVNVLKIKSLFVVSARENLAVTHRRQLSSNQSIIVSANLEDHPQFPRKKDVVRNEIKIYALYITKVDELQTKVELYFQNDPKGSIPAFVMNNVIQQFLSDFEKDVESILQIKGL